MAKRRTRKDKVAAQHHYSLPLEQTPVANRSTSKPVKNTPLTQTVYLTTALQNRYILKDLTKTVLISLMILFLELGLYRYWN